MSRRRTMRINKAKVTERLAEIGMNQIELAESIGCNHQALNRALHKGKISEFLGDRIGRLLDLAPEYLADETPDALFPDAPHNYALHLAQESYNYPFDGVKHMLQWLMIDTEKNPLSQRQYRELFMKYYEVTVQYLDEQGIRKR